MLNRISASNFKSFRHLDYKCAKLNLLTGVNGAGKSSFIQLLLFLKAISSKRLNNVTIRADEIGFQGRFNDLKYCYAKNDDAIKVEVDFTVREEMAELPDGTLSPCIPFDTYVMPHLEDGDCVYQDECGKVSLMITLNSENSISVNHSSFFKRLLDSYPSEYADLKSYFSSIGRPVIGEHFKEYASRWQKRNILFSRVATEIEKEEDIVENEKLLRQLLSFMRMISAFRIKPQEVHDVGYEVGQFNPEGNNAIGYLYVAGRHFMLSSKNPMRHRSMKSEGMSFLIDEVNAWLGEVSPGAKINIESVEVGDIQKFVESIDYGDGELHRTFKPQNVGFGISYILPVLVTLLTASPNDIVVIENPEAHLHPRGQSEIGKLLACASAWGVQLFVETHSDHVINGVRVAVKEGVIKPEDVKVAFFERGMHIAPSEGVETPTEEVYTSERDILIDKNGALSEYPTDFLDEWNNQLMELM